MKRPWYTSLLFALVGLPAYPYGRGMISWWTAVGAMAVIAVLIRAALRHFERSEPT
jgi:protein-S-isoprenylcysteine O-methyltransferase Ste14